MSPPSSKDQNRLEEGSAETRSGTNPSTIKPSARAQRYKRFMEQIDETEGGNGKFHMLLRISASQVPGFDHDGRRTESGNATWTEFDILDINRNCSSSPFSENLEIVRSFFPGLQIPTPSSTFSRRSPAEYDEETGYANPTSGQAASEGQPDFDAATTSHTDTGTGVTLATVGRAVSNAASIVSRLLWGDDERQPTLPR
ncbi:hypothetical protein I316_05692 [Kwoniella heveanensis BCC8398]|uniref:Uncharacterized protein n=1 Tax=Kwoniella heveanensis BCC8398 TaxID=1296120 RepID=A0A1B9GN86_9TREE|nr:hypothetical protein I316_05692 [Kwoniella heveanensis BCC8398]